MKFLLDENASISIKNIIKDLGHEGFSLHDFNRLGIKNGEVANYCSCINMDWYRKWIK